MDIILMVGFIVGGIYILTTGKIPGWLIGENRNLSQNHSRWLGIMLIVTVPIVFLGLVLLPIILGEDAFPYTILFEWGILILVSLLFVILARNLGKKTKAPCQNRLSSSNERRKAHYIMQFSALPGSPPSSAVRWQLFMPIKQLK